MFNKTIINEIDHEVRAYLKETKKLTDAQITNKMNSVPKGYEIGFVQSFKKEAGIIRATQILQKLNKWDEKNDSDQLIFSYLKHNMGRSVELRTALLEVLAKKLGVYNEAHESYMRLLASQSMEGPTAIPFYRELEDSISHALQRTKIHGIEMQTLNKR